MTLSVAQFKEDFREFATASTELVQAKLNQAARSLDATAWGHLFDDGHAQLTAHLLALSPKAQNANLRMGGGANQRTVYQNEYERLVRVVGGSYRTVLE